MNPEVFYLQFSDEQRGPYTVPQIDHLVNSALVPPETLYWREGMEHWLPVTDLVAMRQQPSVPWTLRRFLPLLALLPVLFLARLFGPIALVGWRETAQYDFTPRAAYWRARDVVRHQAAPKGAVINFDPADRCPTELISPPGARVRLHAELPGRPAASWEVALSYDPQLKVWSGRSVREVRP